MIWLRIKQGGRALFRWTGRTGRWLKDSFLRIPPPARKWTGYGLLGFMIIYYPLGMAIMHTVDDDMDYAPAAISDLPGGSVTVATVASLIDREVNEHGWVSNDPFFMPSVLLDNMPNFQQGLFAALARFTIELRDQIGRTRGSSATDPDLEDAGGLLPYPGDVWIFNFQTSWLPTASSERQYTRARQSLLAYNGRLANGEAVFDRRNDNLLATLDRIALDVGASSAAIDDHIRARSNDFIDLEADNLFYTVKGQTYGYYMILKGLRRDFAAIIEARDLNEVYDQMLASFRELAALDPWVVTNGELDSQILPNHLAAQGFYLLRARTQLREITNILLK